MFAASPHGFTKTDMRYGKWNHTKHFVDRASLERFTNEWHDVILDRGSMGDTLVFDRATIENIFEEEAENDVDRRPLTDLFAKKMSPDVIEIWRTSSGYFLVREF